MYPSILLSITYNKQPIADVWEWDMEFLMIHLINYKCQSFLWVTSFNVVLKSVQYKKSFYFTTYLKSNEMHGWFSPSTLSPDKLRKLHFYVPWVAIFIIDRLPNVSNYQFVGYSIWPLHCMIITMTSQWVQWHLKSPASPLFSQQFNQVQIKENIKAQCHWPLCREFTGDRWIPHTNGQ